jgi:hypothetical protein
MSKGFLFKTGKIVFIFIFSALTFLKTNAQDNTEQAGTLDDLALNSIKLPVLSEVNGSLYLTADYVNGSVKLTQGKTVADVPVKFNIYSNAIMVQRDGQDLKLESFEMVSYEETNNDGSVKHFNFKAGYPDVDNHNSKTIYQVLSMGPTAHLLKFMSQKVEDAATLGDYSRREIVTTEQLYIYVPGGQLKKIKANKQSLVDALPELASKIDEIAKASNLKLKNESDIVVLVEALNKP